MRWARRTCHGWFNAHITSMLQNPILQNPPSLRVAALDDAENGAEWARVIAKVAWRLVPFLCLLFVINYLDRSNIAMARLRMLVDTGLKDETYGFGAGLFFIGYFLFEVPSNLILEKVGARIWIARIMITWGLISGCMMFVRGPMSFYALRFLLGAAEAGFFPGIVLYLTYWVPSSRRAGVLAAFLTSTAVSGIIGNPLAGVLMKLEGVHGLHGWQWMFLAEGVLPVLVGFVVLARLPDKPRDARWLSDAERETLAAALDREAGNESSHHHASDFAKALSGWRLWHLSIIYFLLIMGLYGFIYWAPTILKSVATGKSDLEIGFLSAVPYLVGAVTMMLIGRHADHHNERRWHVAICAIIAAGGVMLISRCHALGTVMPAMCVAAIGIFGSLGPFWALSTRVSARDRGGGRDRDRQFDRRAGGICRAIGHRLGEKHDGIVRGRIARRRGVARVRIGLCAGRAGGS